jgi:hypothetical protein
VEFQAIDSPSGDVLTEKNFALTEDDVTAALTSANGKVCELLLRNSVAPLNLLNLGIFGSLLGELHYGTNFSCHRILV